MCDSGIVGNDRIDASGREGSISGGSFPSRIIAPPREWVASTSDRLKTSSWRTESTCAPAEARSCGRRTRDRPEADGGRAADRARYRQPGGTVAVVG